MELERDVESTKERISDLDNGRVELGRAAKMRLNFAVPADHELNWLQSEFKRRGIQKTDLGEIVAEALSQVPKAWWAQKVDELTPLEFKLQQALENPELREKLSALLATMDSNQDALPV